MVRTRAKLEAAPAPAGPPGLAGVSGGTQEVQAWSGTSACQ